MGEFCIVVPMKIKKNGSFTVYPLLLSPQNAIHKCQESWRKGIATAVTLGIPVPAFSSALAFYDGIRSEKLPANLIQVYFHVPLTPVFYLILLTYFNKHLILRGWGSSCGRMLIMELEIDVMACLKEVKDLSTSFFLNKKY